MKQKLINISMKKGMDIAEIPPVFFKEAIAIMEKSIKKYCRFLCFLHSQHLSSALSFLSSMGIYLSFCKFTTVRDAKFVGFSNYVEAFKDNTFTHAFGIQQFLRCIFRF